MANFFLLQTDIYLDYGVTKHSKLSDEVSFTRGIEVDINLPSLVFEVDFPESEPLPHFLDSIVPVASKTFVETLRIAGVANFQIYPATLINPETKKRWENYWALNVLGLASCARLERSAYDVLMAGDSKSGIPDLLAFHTLVLDRNKVGDRLLFRLTESPSDLIAHQKIYDALVKHRPPEGWGIHMTELEVV